MREAQGGMWLFVIVFTMIILFSGIMLFTVNHSNAFAVKDQIVTIIEKNNGFDINSSIDSGVDQNIMNEIVETFHHNSYRQTGKCNEPTDPNKVKLAAYDREGNRLTNGNRASFCLYKIKGYDGDSVEWDEWDGQVPAYYYQVVVFYVLDIPIINTLTRFKEIGETRALTG